MMGAKPASSSRTRFKWSVTLTTFAALVIGVGGKAKGIHSFAGPYTAYAERLYNCPGQYLWSLHIRTTHFNPAKPTELQRLNGNFTVRGDKNLTDNVWLKAVIDSRSNNMWKENAFIFNFPSKGCSTFRSNLPSLFNAILKPSPEDKTCFITPENGDTKFVLRDEPVDWVFPNFPIMPYGVYRFRALLGEKKDVYGCFVADCHIIPKL